jgi:hypothetical protein
MAEPLRWANGTRVLFQRRKDARARQGVLVEDCAQWHHFATVLLDGEKEPFSVWTGDVKVDDEAVKKVLGS